MYSPETFPSSAALKLVSRDRGNFSNIAADTVALTETQMNLINF